MKAIYLLTKLQTATVTMRDTQKAYFAEKNPDKKKELLASSKKQEHQVDEITETIGKLMSSQSITE